jgi:hypothetical protein
MTSPDPGMPLCSATTRAGNPCPFHVRHGGAFCKNHLPAGPERTPVMTNGHDEPDLCAGTLRDGRPCPLKARYAGLCARHAAGQPLTVSKLQALAASFDQIGESYDRYYSAAEFAEFVALEVAASHGR